MEQKGRIRWFVSNNVEGVCKRCKQTDIEFYDVEKTLCVACASVILKPTKY